jgi:hypothetical protein
VQPWLLKREKEKTNLEREHVVGYSGFKRGRDIQVGKVEHGGGGREIQVGGAEDGAKEPEKRGN